jgi:hypothetical protein
METTKTAAAIHHRGQFAPVSASRRGILGNIGLLELGGLERFDIASNSALAD